jgi:hypothetical protein
MAEKIQPVVRALMLCDHVCLDKFTAKFYLLGLVGEFFANAFPNHTPPFGIYVELTGLGKNPTIGIRIGDVDDEHEPIIVHRAQAVIRTESRNEVARSIFEFPMGMAMPKPGMYKLELFVNDEYVADRLIEMRLGGPK